MTLADMIKQLTELRKQMPATAPVYLGTAFGDTDRFFTDFCVSKIGGKIIGFIPSDRWQKHDNDVRKKDGIER